MWLPTNYGNLRYPYEIIALTIKYVKRRRDIVDILGFDVAGKLSDDIVKNTAMASTTVTLSPLSA
jgi:hypothetical protein